MRAFEFDDYKDFVRQKLRTLAPNGHGQFSKIAKHMGIHTSMVSQVFNGDKHLTFDQACALGSYFGFSDLETDYFVALVQLDRAGNEEARGKCRRELLRLKAQASSFRERLTQDRQLSESENAMFYSHWHFAAAKLISSIPGCNSREEIAARLGVSLRQMNQAVEFLLSSGLCVEVGDRIVPGPKNTHLGADSPIVARHHQNWRVKGFEKMGDLKPSELFLTMPATLTRKDALALRQKLVEFVDEFVTVIDASSSEALYSLNIDWFEV